jgi:putative FmdB family regulatory protein
MPTYEYRCHACGHEFETEQRITENALKDCPQCNAPKLERLISGGAFHLKGGGWYKDLYASSQKPKRSDKQVEDRVQKAINDDKAKTASTDSKKKTEAA